MSKRAMIGFGIVLGAALVAGLTYNDRVDPDTSLYDLACTRGLEDNKPAPEWSSSELLAKDACAAAKQADGSFDQGPELLKLARPHGYTHYSGFIITERTIHTVLAQGFVHGVTCANDFYKYGTAEDRSLGGEWAPDERRRRCVEAHADGLTEYQVLAGPNEDDYFITAIRHRYRLYIGWTFIRALDFQETVDADVSS